VEYLASILSGEPSFPSNPPLALTAAFEKADALFLNAARAARPPIDDGTTAVVALVVGEKVYVANAGDSRAILIQRNGRVEALSDDHKVRHT
jgi:serine/threonine protein phosphatase PrpC